LVPIPRHDPLGMRRRDLRLQRRQLRRVQRLGPHVAEHGAEVRARDGRDGARDVGEGRGQVGDGRVVEVVPVLDRLDLVEGRVARSDHGDGTRGHGRAVVGGQVAGGAEGLEGFDDGGPGGGAGGFDVDEEVQGLGGGGVEDAVLRRAGGQEGAVGVLTAEDVEDGLDVEGIEGAGGRERGLLVADVQGVVVEPDVRFDRDGADGEGAVEGEGPPVVVVRVQGFGHDALGQVGGVGVEGPLLGVGEDGLEGLAEGDVGLGGGARDGEGGGEEGGEHDG